MLVVFYIAVLNLESITLVPLKNKFKSGFLFWYRE